MIKDQAGKDVTIDRPPHDEALDELSALNDADDERIVALLADLDPSAEEASDEVAAQVTFGDVGEMLVTDEDAGFEAVRLTTEAGENTAGNGTTPFAEGPKDTALTEFSACVESGSMPTEALPIKIIFEDNGSASGSLI